MMDICQSVVTPLCPHQSPPSHRHMGRCSFQFVCSLFESKHKLHLDVQLNVMQSLRGREQMEERIFASSLLSTSLLFKSTDTEKCLLFAVYWLLFAVCRLLPAVCSLLSTIYELRTVCSLIVGSLTSLQHATLHIGKTASAIRVVRTVWRQCDSGIRVIKVVNSLQLSLLNTWCVDGEFPEVQTQTSSRRTTIKIISAPRLLFQLLNSRLYQTIGFLSRFVFLCKSKSLLQTIYDGMVEMLDGYNRQSVQSLWIKNVNYFLPFSVRTSTSYWRPLRMCLCLSSVNAYFDTHWFSFTKCVIFFPGIP